MTPLPLIAAAFVIGVMAGLPASPAVTITATVALLGLGTVTARRWGGGAAVALLAAALLVGAVRGHAVLSLVPRPRLESRGGVLTGRVVEGCVQDVGAARCVVLRPDGVRVALRTPRGACTAAPGDVLTAVGQLRPLAPEVNGARLGPGGGRARHGITFSVAAAGCSAQPGRPDVLERLRRAGLWVRATLGEGLDRALDREAARAAHALLFGDEARLDPGDVEAFRDSGLAHLLAVSGAHVALLAALLGALVRALARRVPALAARGLVQPLGVLVPLPIVGVFVLATGESASAVRALVGALLAAAATVAGRRARGEAVVAGSAMVTLAVAPALVGDAGWQLSIVAAWALAAGPDEHEAGTAAPSWWRAVLGSWREGLVTSARVAVAAAPVLAWHFQRVPASAIAANAIAAPLAEAVALPLVLATGVLGAWTPAVGRVLGQLAAPVLSSLLAMPRAALALPLATLPLPPPTPAQAVALTAAALALMRASWRARALGMACVLPVVAALEASHLAAAHPRGVLRVTALDVGQGDALLVDLPDGAAMLVDAGGGRSGAPDPGRRIVVPFLADRRRQRLAVVVASHPHPDHIGGLPAVLGWARVEELWDTRQGELWPRGGGYAWLRAAAHAAGVAVRGPEALCGPPRAFHGVMLEVLSPCEGVRADDPPNDASLVLRLTFGRARVLLPGDLEREGEARLTGALGPVTLLKVGHHGSRTSSTEAFLDALQPRVALVSAGHPSPFGHPHTDVLTRLHARGIPVWSTAEHGAVAVVLRADGSFAVGHGEQVDRWR
jgi:competence protein ComEC